MAYAVVVVVAGDLYSGMESHPGGVSYCPGVQKLV